MSASHRPLAAHWPQERTSHWTRDGRFHTGAVETCADCATRPDVRAPATLGSVGRSSSVG